MYPGTDFPVVKILSKEGRKIFGAGFLIGEKWIVSCAHVIAEALKTNDRSPKVPMGTLYVAFPLSQPKLILKAHLVFWDTKKSINIAFLELDDIPPTGIKNPKIITSGKLLDHDVSIFGFVPGEEIGSWTRGVVYSKLEQGWFQVDTQDGTGFNVISTLEGSPVWDEQLNGIIGVAVASMNDNMDEAVYFIPAELIKKVWLKYPEYSIPNYFSSGEYVEIKNNRHFSIPPIPKNYVDRPEVIQAIKNLLLGSGKEKKCKNVAICGEGGIGKTTIAIFLAHDKEIQNHFYDGIFWINLGKNLKIPSVLDELLKVLDDTKVHSQNMEKLQNNYTNLFIDKKFLLIFDDVVDLNQIKPFIEGIPSCSILITTRYFPATGSPDIVPYSLQGLTEDQALEFLSNRLGKKLENEEKKDVSQLAKFVNYIPLALAVIAGLLILGISLKKLLTDFNKSASKNQSERIGEDTNGLETSIRVCIKELPREKLDALIWLGVLSESVVITSLIAASIWKTNEGKAKETLYYLQNVNLLTLQGEEEFCIHPIVHDMVRKMIPSSPIPRYEEDLPGLGLTFEDAKKIVEENLKSYSGTRIATISDEAIKKKAENDHPVESENEDKLGFGVYTNALSEFISSKETGTPLTIGINGPWGSGKTSLMRMVKEKLEPSKSILENCKESITWIKWIIVSIALLIPISILKIIPLIGNKVGKKNELIKDINKGIYRILNYDPHDQSKENLESVSKSKLIKYVAKVCGWRCRKEPKTHFTVWFNAWQFQREDQLWAAIALSVLEQIKNRYNPIQWLVFWIKLSLKRFSWKGFIRFSLEISALPLVLIVACALWCSETSLGLTQINNISQFNTFPFGATLENIFIQYLLPLGTIISASIVLFKVYKLFKDSSLIPVAKITEKPNYKERIGFVKDFKTDFSNIVSSITHPFLSQYKQKKLIIFIDDLDRCKPSKVVDIIEAINLFLDSEGCIFVLGIDSRVVIASIEAKYGEIMEKVRDDSLEFISPGKLFLEKIIQVPFNVPLAKKEDIEYLVKSIIETENNIYESKLNFDKNEENVDLDPEKLKNERVKNINDIKNIERGNEETGLKPQSLLNISYSNKEVRDAILKGASVLSENPRQVKRFINMFRLQAYIANQRGIFEERKIENEDVGITIDKLATWVAWSIRWGVILDYMIKKSKTEELRSHLEGICWFIKDDYSISTDDCEDLIETLNIMRNSEKDRTFHWCHLPWDSWYFELDFLKAVKDLECFWIKPEGNQSDWLNSIMKMTKITSPYFHDSP